MYKIIISFIILLMLFNNNNITNAKSSCTIKKTPEYILLYIKNLKKITSNISVNSKTKAKKEKNKLSTGRQLYINEIYWSLNSLFSWNQYNLDYDVIVQWNFAEIPSQLKRDLKLLQKEKESIIKLNDQLAKNKQTWTSLTYNDICAWVDPKICNIEKEETMTALAALTQVEKSIIYLISKLKNQATTKDINITIENRTFVFPKTDLEKLKKDYSKENLENCSKAVWPGWLWFFGRIIKSIKKIDLSGKKLLKWIDDWSEAVDILWWSSDEKKQKTENRKKLKEELQKQWLWWDTAKTIIDNRVNFNISWSWKDFLNTLSTQVNTFKETVNKEYKEKKTKYLSVTDFSSKKENLKSTEEIIISINSRYGQLKEMALEKNEDDEILVNKVIKLHLNISESINILKKTCKIALKTCNQQKRWEWDCWTCG